MKCPICEEGELKKGKIEGNFPALICNKCKESFTDSETTRKLIQKSEKQIAQGKFTKANTTMSDEKIDNMLTGKLQ